jgi:hypothetical protein
MRSIDADELKENLKKWFPKFTLDGIEAKTLFNQILHDIDNAPTINVVEQNEYTSCKGCKYYSYGCLNGYPCINCRRNFKLVDEIREQKNDLWKDGTPNG